MTGGGERVLGFPEPGRLLRAAFFDLHLAADGDEHQKAALGDPALLPRPWDPPTCRDPDLRQELWEWLDGVVIWLNHDYTWDPDAMIPPCWPQHPHLVHEIAVLADQRRRAGLALDSNALEEWHRYSVPTFTERMKSRLKAHCEQDHQPWPGRGRHTRHTDQSHREYRRTQLSDDLKALTPDQPWSTPRPRLALIGEPGEYVRDSLVRD